MSAFYRGKTVLLTGAASGIGRCLAVQLAEAGAKLILMDIDRDGLEETRRSCAVKPTSESRITTLTVDVRDLAAMRQAFAELPTASQEVDLMIANAGISRVTAPKAFDVDANRAIMEVNYFGSVNAVSTVLPGMLARGRGQLVAISSLAGYRGLPGSACYSASKAAQAVFFEGLRIDLRKEPITVSIVASGFVDTPINKPLHELYHLPFMVAPERAARIILRGVEKGRSEIRFPIPATIMGIYSRLLPNWLYDAVVSFNPFKKRPSLAPAQDSQEPT